MEFVKDLKINQKFILMLVFPLAGLCFFAANGLYGKFQVARQMDVLQEIADLSVKISEAIHETQKERGASAVYIGSKGTQFSNEMREQQALTDEKTIALEEYMEEHKMGRSELNAGLTQLKGIGLIRRKIDGQALEIKELLDYYNKMNEVLVEGINQIIKGSGDANLTVQISAYVNFLQGKERAGIERAVLSNTFAADAFAPGLYTRFLALVVEQQTYKHIFFSFISPPQRKFFEQTMSHSSVVAAERMRGIAMEKGIRGNFGVDVGHWYNKQTEKINQLKKVEDRLAADLIAAAGLLKGKAHRDLLLFSFMAFASFGFALLISVFMARNINRPLGQMIETAQRFIDGDTSSRAQIINRDEIGDMGMAFNEMVETVVGAQLEAADSLKKATIRANIVENSATNIVVVEPDLTISYANPQALKTFKEMEGDLLSRADQVLGNSIDILVSESGYKRAIFSDATQLPFRSQFAQKSHHIDLAVASLQDDKGKHIGAIVSWELVTERVRLQSKVQQAAEAAETGRREAETARGDAEVARGNAEAAAQRERKQAEDLQLKVDHILEVVQAAGNGDLTRHVEVQGEDAIGQLGEGLEYFFTELRQTVGVIFHNAEALSGASTILNRISHELEGNARQASFQADAVSANAQTVSESLQAMASAVEENTTSISEVLDKTRQAAQMAQKAVQINHQTNNTIEVLGTSSSQIGGVIQLIVKIADQTNLLALNASIEAARAGEVGKGFAVVANEVKELAKGTSVATNDISSRVDDIQSKTDVAIEALGDVSSMVERINTLQTGIAAEVEQQTATANEIAMNVTRGAEGGMNIAASIEEVASTAQASASGAEKTQEAAGKLTLMAAQLQDFVNRFNIGEGNGPGQNFRPADIKRIRGKLESLPKT
jgi:methyl-accepting chemotaxis protein